MPDTSEKNNINRFPLFVSETGKKTLRIPKLDNFTGIALAEAVHNAL